MDDVIPIARAEEIDAAAEAREIIDALPRLDSTLYDRRKLHRALSDDVDALTQIWDDIRRITIQQDAKLQQLKQLLQNELCGQKVLVFTYYKDTSRYLYRALTAGENSDWRAAAGNPHIRRIDSSVKTPDRLRLIEAFAPEASGCPETKGTAQEIDLLIATDVLSEGQNLQDCGYLINYDLHWNPTRMVQRAGRIDRLGSSFSALSIFNLFPERELEELLGLVKSLTAKIDTINQTGFLDASVLGEVVTPRDFNTLKRIADEDNTVIEEQENFLELASGEALLAQLQKVLATGAREWLTDLDDGIHSGLDGRGARGVFFYFAAPYPEGEGRQHFWRYYDFNRREIMDNRYQIMQLIACGPETPRFPPPYSEVDIFDVQERIIDHILKGVERQQAVASAPKVVSEEQLTIREILQPYLNHPDFDRQQMRQTLNFLKQPMENVYVTRLREALRAYKHDQDAVRLTAVVQGLQDEKGFVEEDAKVVRTFTREDLKLICFEYIWG